MVEPQRPWCLLQLKPSDRIDDTTAKSSPTVVVRPSRENICAIVVTFFPDALFPERLDRIRQQVGKVVIVDNTPDTQRSAPSQHLKGSDIELIQNRENLGIAQALNQGMSRAIQLGNKWVITFDQDSWVHTDLITTLIAICEQQPQPELVGIIGCNFEDENTHLSPMKHKIDGPPFSEVETVITSGSLMSAAVFSKAGPFRSDFFIDFVDHEYCLRLRKLGYKVIVASNPLMIHALGASTMLGVTRGEGKFTLVLTNRSPLRRYYITRNGLIVAKAYFSVAPVWALRTVAGILGFALIKIPFEKTARWTKFRATVYGALDGLRARTGEARNSWLEE